MNALPNSKFLNPNPKLPDMYTLWRDLAQVEHKLEPFARGDRSPAAINAAREALAPLASARHELVNTEVFISETLRALDTRNAQRLQTWETEVDRPDLEQIAYRDEQGQTRVNAGALVGHVRQVADPNQPNCYNCGHPRNAHGGGSDPDVGPGCAVIVEHGYPCDCPSFAEGTARPVAEIDGKPATWSQLEAVNQQFDADLGQHFGNEDLR